MEPVRRAFSPVLVRRLHAEPYRNGLKDGDQRKNDFWVHLERNNELHDFYSFQREHV